MQAIDKRILDRRFGSVTVRSETIGIKIGPHGAKPEHDDLVTAAAKTGIPLRRLAAEAIAQWAENDQAE